MFKVSGFKHIVFLILIAAALVSLSVVMYWKHLDSVLAQRERENLFSLNQKLAENFDNLVNSQLQVLSSVGESLEGLPRVENTYGLMSYLSRQKKRNGFELVAFQFPDGKAYFADGSVRNNFLSEEEVSSVYDNKYYVSAPRDVHGNGQEIITAVPVYRKGVKTGVLLSSRLTTFYDKTISKDLPPVFTPWFVTDAGGEIILDRSGAAHDNIINMWQANKSDNAACPADVLQDINQKRGGAVKCSLRGGDYLLAYVPLAYNNWYLLTAHAMTDILHLPQKQLMTAVFLCVSIIIVLGLLLAFIIHVYRQHNQALYRTGFIYHVTGLGNHNYFQFHFPRYAAAFRKNKTPFTLTVVNIRRFKAINDIYGFEQGDKILVHAAEILREEIKEDELLCHSSADRFLILMSCADRAEFDQRIEKILTRIKHFCHDEKLCFDITVETGVYLADEDVPFYIMMDRANMALNSVREKAGQSFAFYNDEYREQIKLITDIESKMNAALAGGQFKVFLQPKYDFQTGRIESAEALVRWQDGQKLIPPDKFIPVFEKNGFVLKLDMFILEETVKLLARRIKEGKRVVPVGVNFSRLHMEDHNFINSVTEILDRYNLPHEPIELEITESIAFDKREIMRDVLDELHARGFTVAMDDFGAGYSSLNILKDLHFDCVKLDKEFLTGGEGNARMRQIIQSTVEMIKKLGCVIVTEGVETKEQVEFLKSIGCDLAQGYVFSRPLPSADFEKLLNDDAARN
ncbi:MAG: EAL domain-containing protein [Elusimicrobium sp.]|jgi:diguanylate cyclase (GGDEF)-like protein|nr:EAL domain-containing protein [Elusimicrobium sp.]